MIVTFYSGNSLQVADDKGKRINKAIDAGAEWIELEGNRYRVSNIASISSAPERRYKTYEELSLPKLEQSKEVADFYSKRTISLPSNSRKWIG